MSGKKYLGNFNKKGLFYLFISSLFIVIMIFLFVAYKQYSYTDRQKVIETRISTIDEFIKSIDFDSKRVIFVSGYRSLIALEDHVATTGKYLNATQNETKRLFEEVFYYGTINGANVTVLENATYYDYLQNLKAIAGRIGIIVDINVTDISLNQSSPWSVNVYVSTLVKINDTRHSINDSQLASWSFSKVYSTDVSIINIRDPLYSVNTSGKVPNPIRQNNTIPAIIPFVNPTTNDTTGLQIHTNNSFYVNNTMAPNFLMRLAGNFSNSSSGIESLVNIAQLSNQGVPYDATKSIVDYVLFSNVTGYSNRTCVKNMPSWFRIDTNHTAYYNINPNLYTSCS